MFGLMVQMPTSGIGFVEVALGMAMLVLLLVVQWPAEGVSKRRVGVLIAIVGAVILGATLSAGQLIYPDPCAAYEPYSWDWWLCHLWFDPAK